MNNIKVKSSTIGQSEPKTKRLSSKGVVNLDEAYKDMFYFNFTTTIRRQLKNKICKL